jgi:short-subunit dehydrogenase
VHVSVLCPGWVNTRIAQSARNRPAHLREGVEDEPAEEQAAVLHGVIASGMAPELVAEKVFGAIREEQFWILTHEDPSEFFVNAIERRLQSLRTRSNPTLGGGQFG